MTILNRHVSFSPSPWSLVAAGTTILLGVAVGSLLAYKRRVDTTPNGQPYEAWTKDELYQKAREEDIEGRSSMNKEELIEALRDD